MRHLLIVLAVLAGSTAQAAFQSVEIVAVVNLKTDGVTTGVKFRYVVNDSAGSVQGECSIKGAEFNAVKALTGAARKLAVWTIIRPIIRARYEAWLASQSAAVESEEEDAGSPVIGVLSTETP